MPPPATDSPFVRIVARGERCAIEGWRQKGMLPFTARRRLTGHGVHEKGASDRIRGSCRGVLRCVPPLPPRDGNGFLARMRSLHQSLLGDYCNEMQLREYYAIRVGLPAHH